MKLIQWFLLLVALLFFAYSSPAQQKIIRMGGPGGNMKTFKGEMFDIPELGAMVMKADSGNLRVEHVMPADARPKAYADVDIKSGDEILVLNGKRVKTIKEIESQYKTVPVGGEVKIGLRRGEESIISKFAKADPKDLPQRKMVIINSDGKGGDMRPLPGLGLVIGKEASGVVVKGVMDDKVKPIADAGVAPGDKIVSIDGKPVKSMEDFAKNYDAVAAGKSTTWIVTHGGKDLTISLTKPESKGQVIIKREIK
jgi:C-terminal processing protease CtpA/Prc